MSSVTLSATVRANLLALQQIASAIGQTQIRLANGKRVNSAIDGPAAFFTATALNARAAELNQIVDDVGLAKKVVEAANNGIDAIQTLIKNARDLAYQALSSSSTLAKVTGTATGLTPTTAISMADGKTVTVGDGTNTVTYIHATGQTVQDFINVVNNDPNLNIDASLTADGRLQLTASALNNVVIGGTASAGELSGIGLSAGTTTSTLNTTRQALAQQFDSIRDQIDAVALDASFNGQNLLGGSVLTITFNETGSAKLSVNGSVVSSANLGVNSAVSTAGSFQSDADINAFLANLDAATTTLRSKASSFGSSLAVVGSRETFIKDMSNLLTTGADSLVMADPNEEGATLLALQTRRDLAVTSLSLASRGQSDALRLFGLS